MASSIYGPGVFIRSLCVIALISCAGSVLSQPARTISASHSLPGNGPADITNETVLKTLADNADVIVVGKVGELASEWNEDKSRIRTQVRISVNDGIKGAAPGELLTVTVPGGEVDGVGEWYSHTARFEREEDVVLFGTRDTGGRIRVTGGQIGKLSIRKDHHTGTRMIANVGTVDNFTTRIRNLVKSSGTGR